MGQEILVENQIEDGLRFVERLVQDDFPVTAACWVKTSEDGMWYLYIASPLVDTEGPKKSYRRVYALMQRIPQPFRIHPFDVKLVGAGDAIAEGVRRSHQRYPDKRPVHYGETQLGGVNIEGAYVYPAVDTLV
jgi:hypothetical protein